VISLYYQGLTRDQTSQRTGLSTGKVSGTIASERKRLGEGNVDAIRRLGLEMHKSGGSWLTLASALAISNYCKQNNISQEMLKQNLPAIYQKLKDHGRNISYLPEYIEDREKLKYRHRSKEKYATKRGKRA
jgi:hypothetical protein